MNKYTTVSLMYYKYIQECINQHNLQYDYVIKIRNDVLLKINNIKKYFNEKTYVAPRYWFCANIKNTANDHLIITPFTKFMSIDFSDENINNLARVSYDTEILTENLFLPDSTIDVTDVVEYVLNGTWKFHIKHNTLISGNISSTNTFAIVNRNNILEFK